MDDEGPAEIGVVANGSEDRRGGVVWRFLSGSRYFAGGVHVQLEGYGRCQLPGGGIEIRGRMKVQMRVQMQMQMQMHMGIAVWFVVSGAMPLIFSDDVMLKSKLGPVLDLRLFWASVSNPSPSPSPLFGRREAGVLILVVFQSGL
jgi:hypothetical protein